MEYYGYLAASCTACFWSFTSMFFAAAGRRIGSFTVNQFRLVMAVLLLLLMHYITTGAILPWNASTHQILLFAVSGIVGLVIGDSAYFASLVLIGPKRAAVIMIFHVPIAAIAASVVFGESLTIFVITGMSVTILGIILAVRARKHDTIQRESSSRKGLGVFLGFIGATGQGIGIIIAKLGLENFEALSGTLIRMISAAIIMWFIAGIQQIKAHRNHLTSSVSKGLKNKTGVGYTFCGAFFGPFLGVWFSLIAVKYAPVAITTTIMATFPILIIPQTMLFYREKPGILEIMGAILAVVGVAILFVPDIGEYFLKY